MDAAARLEIHLLGGFRVALGGQLLPAARWRRGRAAALVKLLALAPGHQLHREQAMEALWPTAEPAAAGISLRVALHHARQPLAAVTPVDHPYLRRDGDLLILGPPESVWVDVE